MVYFGSLEQWLIGSSRSSLLLDKAEEVNGKMQKKWENQP